MASVFNAVNRRVEKRISDAIFAQPIIGNTLRGMVVEAMIAEAITIDGWEWVGADWSSWDFEHQETWATIEVKQSAARQPWSDQYTHKARPRFDIAERTGYWFQAEGSGRAEWHEERCRPADIFIFAWHGETSAAANQRDVGQWQFYPLATHLLPDRSSSIALSRVQQLVSGCDWSALREHIRIATDQVGVPRQRRA